MMTAKLGCLCKEKTLIFEFELQKIETKKKKKLTLVLGASLHF